MIPIHLLAGLLVAATVVFFLTPRVKNLAFRLGAVDRPDNRKIHQEPIARLGGVAIYLAFWSGALFSFPFDLPEWGLLAGSTLIMLVGLVDDMRGLAPMVKLGGQIGAALVLVAFGLKVEFLTNPFDGLLFLGNLAIPVTVLWLVGVTNALNLIDGLDGLAAGTAAIAAATISTLALVEGQPSAAWMAAVLGVAAASFLRFNFFPARIFMGDSGSMFLGFTLAAIAIMGLTKGVTAISLITPVIILGLPLFDTTLAILRRFFSRQPIFSPDKEHLHHRLLGLGLSQRRVVLLIYTVNACLGASAVVLNLVTTEQGVFILVLLAMAGVVAINRLDFFGNHARRRGGRQLPSLERGSVRRHV